MILRISFVDERCNGIQLRHLHLDRDESFRFQRVLFIPFVNQL